MTFRTQEFKEAYLVPREEDVAVPDMKDWFTKKSKPVWKVRGLTGKEIGRANEASQRNEKIATVLEGLVSKQSAKIQEALKQLFDPTTPQDIAKRLEHIQIGSVDPVCDLDLAKKICQAFPIEFYTITNKIVELSGAGHVPGKRKPSSKTKKSK